MRTLRATLVIIKPWKLTIRRKLVGQGGVVRGSHKRHLKGLYKNWRLKAAIHKKQKRHFVAVTSRNKVNVARIISH